MSDLFYGSPPPRSPSPPKAPDRESGTYTAYDISSAKTPGYVPTSPEQIDFDNDDNNKGEEKYGTAQTPFQSVNQDVHLSGARTPSNFHNADEVLDAKTPGHFGGATMYDRDEDENMAGAKTPGVAGGAMTDEGVKDTIYRLNATTPYHFGGSPGPDFPEIENAEVTRQTIYEQIARDQAEQLEINRLNAPPARTPSFAESAAMLRTPRAPSVYEDGINRSGSRTINQYPAAIPSRNTRTISGTPYVNPNDPRRNRPKPAPATRYANTVGARTPAMYTRTPMSIANDTNVRFNDDDASVADSEMADLETASTRADMASIDAAVPNLRADPNAGRMNNLVDPFKMPARPVSNNAAFREAGTNSGRTPVAAGGRNRRVTDAEDINLDARTLAVTPLQSTSTPTHLQSKRKRPVRGESDDEGSPIAPTPKKRTSKAPKVAVPKTPKPPKTPKTPKTPKERVRAPPKNGKAVDNKPIPRSFAECDEADKQLIMMRDAGEPWAPIKAKYSELTGDTYGHSTLPNRYERLKANFITVREEDNILILEAKREIEEEFDASKWGTIAERVIEKEGGSYDGTTLQRQFKKLMQNQGFNVRDGMARQDVDFAGENSDGEGEYDDE